MVHRYRKGYRAEWMLTHKLSKMGYMAIRAPRSGRIGLASPDIVAVKDGKIIVVECKSREAAFRIHPNQLAELQAWNDKGGAAAYVGWKRSRTDWVFLKLDDVLKNEGKINRGIAEKFGIKIDAI